MPVTQGRLKVADPLVKKMTMGCGKKLLIVSCFVLPKYATNLYGREKRI